MRNKVECVVGGRGGYLLRCFEKKAQDCIAVVLSCLFLFLLRQDLSSD